MCVCNLRLMECLSSIANCFQSQMLSEFLNLYIIFYVTLNHNDNDSKMIRVTGISIPMIIILFILVMLMILILMNIIKIINTIKYTN